MQSFIGSPVEFLGEIARKTFENSTGLITFRRKTFGDPLLSVYMLRGEPVFAESFLIKRKWWEGLLEKVDVENNLFGDVFAFAKNKHGQNFIQHLKNYSKEVAEVALDMARNFGWELEIETSPFSPEEIEEMFHVRAERITSDAAIRIQSETSKDQEKLSLDLRAFGFPIFHIPNDGKNRSNFFRVIHPMRNGWEVASKLLERVRGSVALVFPLFLVARLELNAIGAWVVSKSVRKIIFALERFEPVEEIPENVLQGMEVTMCCRFVFWMSKDKNFILYDPLNSNLTYLTPDELERLLNDYFSVYEKLLQRAERAIPANLPPKMRARLLKEMMGRNPCTQNFAEEFHKRFGVNLNSLKSN
ncbi:MAG: hypothetical protein GXO39_07800 [Thermotogae bacterium]|nr:hypothetical protein [Thermotogota bacterium]